MSKLRVKGSLLSRFLFYKILTWVVTARSESHLDFRSEASNCTGALNC